MMFSQLSKIEIRKPFTVSSLFNENFYVEFKNIIDKTKLTEDIIVSGNSYSLSSLEDNEFVFEEITKDLSEKIGDKIKSIAENERAAVLVTTGFSEDNPICISVMDDEKDRILMCAYIKTLFDIFFKKYEMKSEYAIFHHQQINEEIVELPHIHIILTCDKDSEGFSRFCEDFKDNIFDE